MDERCRDTSCPFNRTRRAEYYGYNCGYMDITGRSRIAQLPPDLRKPCDCPLNKKRRKPVDDRPRAERDGWADKAEAMYDAGATDKEIAAAVGCDPKYVREWRLNTGRATHSKVVYDWDLAARAYDERKSDREIAELLGCHRQTVTNWRERTGRECLGLKGRKKREN